MFRSLHMKLMLIMTLLIIALMTVVGAFLVNSVSGFYLEQFYSQMQGVFQNDPEFPSRLETLKRAAALIEFLEPDNAPEAAGEAPAAPQANPQPQN